MRPRRYALSSSENGTMSFGKAGGGDPGSLVSSMNVVGLARGNAEASNLGGCGADRRCGVNASGVANVRVKRSLAARGPLRPLIPHSARDDKAL